MMITRDVLDQLYTPIYDEFMLEEYAEESQVNQVVFKQLNDSSKEYKVDSLGGMPMWEDANEAEGGGYNDPTLGYPKTYTQTKKWMKLEESFESVDQDEYALLKKEAEVREMGRGARARVEYDTSRILANGFGTAGPDGEYLFDTDHPRNREQTDSDLDSDNLLTGAFSHDNLEAAETQIAENFVSPAGMPIAAVEDPILLYGPQLRGSVYRVLSDRALERPATTLREINRFAGKYRPVEWRYMNGAFNGVSASDPYWFIIFPALGYLKVVWNAKPKFTAWVDEDNETYKFKGRMIYVTGADNWRAGFASTGV